MQREKIEFPTNKPAVLKLDWNEGTLKPSRFGDEYMYMCDNDARVMWVKRELHTLIQESRRPGRQPVRMITDKLRSYFAAIQSIFDSVAHIVKRYVNNQGHVRCGRSLPGRLLRISPKVRYFGGGSA